MKVEFNEAGDLIIAAQDNTERVALASWWKAYNDSRGENGCLHVDTDEYLRVSNAEVGN